MKTQLLYYEHPYETRFTAVALAAERTAKGWRTALDRTLFYPEGGGQPADRGSIGGIPVFYVEKKDDLVWHHTEEKLPEGSLAGEVDWARRFDYMQQHTGQHILSAVMYRDFSFNTVAVHQGEDTTTIELDTGTIDDAVIEAIESAAMELISRNLPVKTENVEEAHIERFDLRREPKVRGLIRVVSLGDYDSVACGGLHTAGTGEVKLLKHTYTEKIRGNIRLHWKIGDRALRDYAMKHGIVSSLVELFSAQAPDLLERVRAFQEELAETRRRTHFIEGRLAGELAHRLYEEALRSRRISKPPSGGDAEPLIITGDFEGEGKDFLKKVSEGIPGEAAWLFAGINRLGDSFQWLIAVSDPKLFDFHRAKDSILSAIDGKGGGRPPLWQGVGSRVDGIPRFFEHLQSGSNPGSG